MLEAAQSALAAAQGCRQLPVDYTDVTEGWLARAKRWMKRKLLGNFKHAYVDVLSRQQSDVNRLILRALEELADCCATLDHKGQSSQADQAPVTAGVSAAIMDKLLEELAHARAHRADLEERLARLEDHVKQGESAPS
jgi:hypothetical protein